ncbi:MAG TPA: DoxX family protein [Chitinophagaceae bacterium]|jgi:putative oxidoreductase|nr:DoxX family protein [Chitinophagaceae bacterium]
MDINNLFKPTYSIAALRMMMGIVFILHAGVRVYNNTLPGFGDFLHEKGFPLGFYLAWAVTLFELTGGILMFFRFFVRIFCIGEMIILITGIVIVHSENGWSIIERSLNGIEYSLVLITILTAIFIAERKAARNISPLL